MAGNKETFEVKGLKELQKQLKTFDNDIMKKAVQKAAKGAMAPVVQHAKSKVPVSSGALRDSIKLSSGTSDQGQQNRVGWAAVSAGGRGAKDAEGRRPGEYVLSQHYGNSQGKKANPFLEDAFVPYAQVIARNFRTELEREVEGGVNKMAKRAKKTK